jgi:phospholipid/cholesterol/gamma-HCH transport system substrate-binding protein
VLRVEGFFRSFQQDGVMNQRRSYEIGTGLFILLGFAALAWLATQTTSVANFSQGPS